MTRPSCGSDLVLTNSRESQWAPQVAFTWTALLAWEAGVVITQHRIRTCNAGVTFVKTDAYLRSWEGWQGIEGEAVQTGQEEDAAVEEETKKETQ